MDMVPVVCSGILDMYQEIVDVECVRGYGTHAVSGGYGTFTWSADMKHNVYQHCIPRPHNII